MDLEVNNESEDTMCVYLATGFFEYGPTAYPDTLLPKDFWLPREKWGEVKLSWLLSYIAYPPQANKSERLIMQAFRKDEWDKSLSPCILPYDTLSAFFICKDTLNLYGYDDIQEKNRVQLRIDFSRDNLKKINNLIHYPPPPKMRHMHMSPSYDEFYKWYNNH